jgi:hypothetical protein
MLIKVLAGLILAAGLAWVIVLSQPAAPAAVPSVPHLTPPPALTVDCGWNSPDWESPQCYSAYDARRTATYSPLP